MTTGGRGLKVRVWRAAAALLGACAWTGLALAQTTLLAGPSGSALPLEQALLQAQDGDTIELLPGDYAGGLVIENRKLTLRGVGGGKAPMIQGDGKAGKLKALWTVRGGQVTLQNLDFRGARSFDGDGAGVRHEGGVLSIVQCGFFDNEYGLFSTHDEKAELRIDSSVFGLAPKVVGGLHHLLNVGRIAKLSISGSRFQQGFEGHLIKTRARENLITYNFIHDGLRGGASFEIEIANGGLATVLGNVIAQGADTQNPVMLGYATEDRTWDKNELRVAHNTFVSYGWLPGWAMRVIRDNLPSGATVQAVNNLIVGPAIFWLGAAGNFEGNRHATAGMLSDIETYAFELPAGSIWRGSGVDPRNIGGHDLSPKAEFEWPLGTRALSADRTSWTPGAYQR